MQFPERRRSHSRKESIKAFRQYFRYVPITRNDEDLHQLDRAMAAVRIQSNIRGSLDRSRMKSFRRSLSQLTAEASSFHLGQFINEEINTPHDIHNQFPNVESDPAQSRARHAKRNSGKGAQLLPISIDIDIGSEEDNMNEKIARAGQQALALMEDIFHATQPGNTPTAEEAHKTKAAFHESVFGNIRIDTGSHKRRNSWEKQSDTDFKLSPEGLRWALRLYDTGKYVRAIALLDTFGDETSYWRDILLSDVMLLRVECFLAMSDYRRALAALELLLSTSMARDIIDKIDETEETVKMNGPEDEVERTVRVFRCMGRLSSMKGKYSNAEKEYQKGLSLLHLPQTSSPRRGLLGLAITIRCSLIDLYIAQGNWKSALAAVNYLKTIKFVTLSDRLNECYICSRMIFTIASWDHVMGNYADADRGYQLSLQIIRESLDADHPAIVGVMIAQAKLKYDLCEFTLAEQYVQQSLSAIERIQSSAFMKASVEPDHAPAQSHPTGKGSSGSLEEKPSPADSHATGQESPAAATLHAMWEELGVLPFEVGSLDGVRVLLVHCSILLALGKLSLAQICSEFCLRKCIEIFSNDLMTPVQTATTTSQDGRTQVGRASSQQLSSSIVVPMPLTTSFSISGIANNAATTTALDSTVSFPIIGQAHLMFGEVEAQLGRVSNAIAHTEHAISVFRALADEYSDQNNDSLRGVAVLGQIELLAGNFEVASQWFQDEIDIRSNIITDIGIDFNRNELNYWKVWLAKAYILLGRLDDAQNILGQAGRELCFALGNNNLKSAEAMLALAELCTSRARYADATLLYQRAMRITVTLVGDKHPQVWAINDALAHNYRLPGYFKEASNCATKALNARIRLFGKNNLFVALSLYSRAQLLRDLFYFQEATAIYAASLRLLKECLGGEQNCLFATVAGEFGECLRRHGKLDAALRVLRKSLALRRHCFGEHSLSVLECFLNMILLDLDMGEIGKLETALVMLKEAVLPQVLELLGPRHPMTVYVKANAGVAANLIVLKLFQAKQAQQLYADISVTDAGSATNEDNVPEVHTLELTAGKMQERGALHNDIAEVDGDANSLLFKLRSRSLHSGETDSQTNAAMAAGYAVIEHALNYFQNYDQLSFPSSHPWVVLIGSFGDDAEEDTAGE